MKTDRGIGDFIGRSPRGLDLDLEREGRDWLIPPSAWQALKAWEWLKRNLGEDPASVAREHGFDAAADIDAEIAWRLDMATASTASTEPLVPDEDGPANDELVDTDDEDVIDDDELIDDEDN